MLSPHFYRNENYAPITIFKIVCNWYIECECVRNVQKQIQKKKNSLSTTMKMKSWGHQSRAHITGFMIDFQMICMLLLSFYCRFCVMPKKSAVNPTNFTNQRKANERTSLMELNRTQPNQIFVCNKQTCHLKWSLRNWWPLIARQRSTYYRKIHTVLVGKVAEVRL